MIFHNITIFALYFFNQRSVALKNNLANCLKSQNLIASVMYNNI